MQDNCQGCGARLPSSAARCDLCGTAAFERDVEFDTPDFPGLENRQSRAVEKNGITRPESGVSARDSADEIVPVEVVYCNQCGVRNPQGARYCNRCGEGIIILQRGDVQDVSRNTESAPGESAYPGVAAPGSPSLPPGERMHGSDRVSVAPSQEGATRQVGIIVGAGVLIVVVWYVFTMLVQDRASSSSPDLFSASSVSIPPQFQEKESELRAAMADVEGEDRILLQKELVDLYIASNRMDLAAGEAEQISMFENTETSWVATANLYYDWMESTDSAGKAFFAKKSIAAYRRALEINPENLDARTDMAIAYMYDPDNPMLAIQETIKVLEYDSLHVNANFNRAIMLLQINRVEQALEQLERVKRIVGDPNDPVYQRAEEVIEETKATTGP